MRGAVDGEVTHIKQTLLQPPAAYDALVQWFPLRDSVLPHLGERGVVVLSYAISTTNDCLLCSLYFRRALLQQGEDVAEPVLFLASDSARHLAGSQFAADAGLLTR